MGPDSVWTSKYWSFGCLACVLLSAAMVSVLGEVLEGEGSLGVPFSGEGNSKMVRSATPMQLVRPAEGHERFEVNQLALDELREIDEPVAIVGVTGPYHGGKSLLLNVLMNSTLGFTVGTNPDPETKGLWMKLIPKEVAKGADDSLVVLLDTEGFYGEGATRSYDAKVFALATLVSSHLIYNTLRTLGDVQSVSALADLAKQAQVFNLNNWLKSGGESLAPEDPDQEAPDVSLLLKTLDFPPLTWVVQGFDMDLDSAHNPMHYLQKYFKAHANTGDRSLDTLFTRGVDCHALRTPADMNFLRERWGDGGLGSHQNLFPLLHPGYIAELRALQRSVFGNLTSKGGLTGRQLASLLPLLVHYVNEDFPLNAERKLRDVLVDVLVDGAFAGGAQYFQARMAEVDRRALSQEEAEGGLRGASLESLVSAAFTDEELEKHMNIAEAYAVAYCEKRCVGVPSERVGPACKGQLGVKISRMRPEYRAENDKRVKEVLVVLGEALRESADAALNNTTLPRPESEVETLGRSILQDRLAEYDAKVGKHRYGQLYGQARSRLQIDIQNFCSQVAAENTRRIGELLKKGKAAYMAAYNHAVEAEGLAKEGETGLKEGKVQPDPLLPKQLVKVHNAALNDAKAAYDNAVSDGGLMWVKPGHEQYDFYHFQATQWTKQRLGELQTLNERRLATMCQRLVTTLLAKFRHDAARFTPFPDNHEALAGKAGALLKSVMGDFAESVKDFAGVAAPEEARQDLQRLVESEVERLVNKNTALMAALCYDPLMDANEELQMQDCEWTVENLWVTKKIWAPKCLFPTPKMVPGFKRKAYLVARRHLDMAQLSFSTSPPPGVAGSAGDDDGSEAKVIAISPATRDKVIQVWMERDLAHYAHLVLVNFTVLLSTTVAMFFATYFTVYKMFSVSRPVVAQRDPSSIPLSGTTGGLSYGVNGLGVNATRSHFNGGNGMGNSPAKQRPGGYLPRIVKVEGTPWRS